KDRLALERMRTVDIVLFDKTGTLTEGAHAVTSVVPAAEATEGEVLALASAAEANSEHPVAQAIVAAAAENEDASAMALRGSDFRTAAGRGVRATVDGDDIMVGGPHVLHELDLAIPADVESQVPSCTERGAVVTMS